MKMKPEHYDALLVAIRNLFATSQHSFTEFRESYRKEGLSDERFRWDLLHDSRFGTTQLYQYLNDQHIDTALRRIVATLELEAKQAESSV